MLSRCPTPFDHMFIDGERCQIMAWIVEKPWLKKDAFRFKAEWKAHGGYKQHAIIDIDIPKISSLVSGGVHKDYIKELIIERYYQRKIAGHGVKPFNPFGGTA